MPQRLSVAQLASSMQFQPPPRFKSALLKSAAAWPKRLGYLRGLYEEISASWNVDGPGGPLYDEAMPKLRELLLGLGQIAEEVADRPDLFRMLQNAQHDFDAAVKHAAGRSIELAVRFLSYSLMKVGSVLDGLTRLANKSGSRHVEAYGYDITGEVMEPGEQESRSPNLWDQSNSPKLNKTPTNPANQLVDAEAENDFPDLKEDKHRRVDWPARTR